MPQLSPETSVIQGAAIEGPEAHIISLGIITFIMPCHLRKTHGALGPPWSTGIDQPFTHTGKTFKTMKKTNISHSES